MIKKIVLSLIALIVIAGGALFAINGKDNYDASKYEAKVSNGINVGSEISFTLPNQFDKSLSSDEDTKTLILTFTKKTGHVVKKFLEKQDKNFLDNKKAFFIADISPMPTVIRNTFALPDLKKSAYSVILLYEGDIATKFKNNDKAEHIAIVNMENGVVKSVSYIDTEDELNSALN